MNCYFQQNNLMSQVSKILPRYLYKIFIWRGISYENKYVTISMLFQGYIVSKVFPLTLISDNLSDKFDKERHKFVFCRIKTNYKIRLWLQRIMQIGVYCMSWQSNAVYNFYSVLSLSYPTNEQKILQIFVIIVASISVGGLGFL